MELNVTSEDKTAVNKAKTMVPGDDKDGMVINDVEEVKSAVQVITQIGIACRYRCVSQMMELTAFRIFWSRTKKGVFQH